MVLDKWWKDSGGTAREANRVTIESPSGIYKITYAPDFGASVGGAKVAVHIWNTMKPDLASRLVLPMLAPFLYPMEDQGFDEVAVLSLRDGTLFRLGDPTPYLDHSALILEHIERLIEDLDDDGRRPPAEDRPAI